MHVAILTFDGFNELDSLIAYSILNRVKRSNWLVSVASSKTHVTSMNGLTIEAQISIHEAINADAVLIGSGNKTRELLNDDSLIPLIKLNPNKQLISAQCSGALIMAKLGLLEGIPACTDLVTKTWMLETGTEVIDQPFFAKDNIATSGGCLASQYLACWIVARLVGIEEAESAMHYVAPVGEKDLFVDHMKRNISPYLL